MSNKDKHNDYDNESGKDARTRKTNQHYRR